MLGLGPSYFPLGAELLEQVLNNQVFLVIGVYVPDSYSNVSK